MDLMRYALAVLVLSAATKLVAWLLEDDDEPEEEVEGE